MATTPFEFTAPVTLGWSHVFELNDDGYYDADFLLPAGHPDIDTLRNLLGELAHPINNGDYEGMLFCLKSGDELAAASQARGKASRDFYKGHVVIKSRTKHPVALAAIINGTPTPISILTATNLQKGLFFCGAEALGAIALNPYEGGSRMSPKGGVNAYLNAISLTGKGERKAGGTSAKAMNLYRGHVTQTDPTKAVAKPNLPF